MILLITQGLAVVAGLVGLLAVWWKYFGSPRAKSRRKAVKDGIQAIKDKDPSAVTAAFDELNK